MCVTVPATITNARQAVEYIELLHSEGLLFHFDDSAHDCLDGHGLADEQLQAIEGNVSKLFAVDWSASSFDCPHHAALSLVNATN